MRTEARKQKKNRSRERSPEREGSVRKKIKEWKEVQKYVMVSQGRYSNQKSLTHGQRLTTCKAVTVFKPVYRSLGASRHPCQNNCLNTRIKTAYVQPCWREMLS